jgi:putative heme-binding domain-containing protein
LSVPAAGAEVDYDLGGLEAEWTPEGASAPAWKGWVPHATTSIALAWTRGTALHESLAANGKRPGLLAMQGQIFLPAPRSTFVADGATAFDLSCGGASKSSERGSDGRYRAELPLPAGAGPFPIRVALRTGVDPDFELAIRNPGDPHLRPIRPEWFSPSWAPAVRPPKPSAEKKTGVLAQGDPVKGREIFFGPEARCSVCHTIRGEGGKVAPDLTPSAHRDPEAVLRDIVDPNAAINPEFVSYVVELTSGDTLNGVVLTQDAEKIVLVDAEGKERPIPRTKIRRFRSSAISLMPDGFKKLGDEKLRDLVAFLCASPDPKK